MSARIHTMPQLPVQSDILYIHTGSVHAHMHSVKMEKSTYSPSGITVVLIQSIVYLTILNHAHAHVMYVHIYICMYYSSDSHAHDATHVIVPICNVLT